MLLTVAAVTMQAATESPRIGVAQAVSKDQVCVAMPSGRLGEGAVVTLVQPTPRQKVITVTVERPVPSCEALEKALIAGPYFLARASLSSAAEPGTVWLAFPGRVSARFGRSDTVAVHLSEAHPDAHVRACASSEGLHLTVWSGRPP
jgi:hypothetical protein